MMCMKEENKRNETVKVFSMTRKKSLWTSKFTAKKYMPNNWKKKIKDHTHHFCPYSCPVLQCIIKTYLACSIALTRKNDIIVNKN